MAHFYESVLIDTVDGFQCKSYSNEHPEGHVIVKPKYIPKNVLEGEGLKYRFLFEKCLIRFNLFDKKNWYFAVPRSKIRTIHDCLKGLQELLQIPKKDLDPYLTLVVEMIEFLTKSGVRSADLGITHSTLLGNYTPGKSDMDILIFGKDNGWKILDYLKTAKHAKLHWKTDKEWADYYQEHKTSESSHFTEEEYVRHMQRKRYEGMFGGTVFTLFTVEEPDERWFRWGEDKIEPLGTATVTGTVTDHYNSLVRPGHYEIKDGKVVDTHGKDLKLVKSLPIRRVVTFSIPFVQQAL